MIFIGNCATRRGLIFTEVVDFGKDFQVDVLVETSVRLVGTDIVA